MSQTDIIKLKFLPFVPSTITQLLYLNDRNLMIVVRENSMIEIIETKNSKVVGVIGLNSNYIIKKVIAGLKNSIFIVTMNNEVLCYDLMSLLAPFNSFTISTSGIWDADYFMVNNLDKVDAKSNYSDMSEEMLNDSLIKEYLFVSTDEGSIYVYYSEMSNMEDLNERQNFTLLKIINNFGKSGAKALSCKADPALNAIFAGYSEGSIKKYAIQDNQQVWSVDLPSKQDVWSLAVFSEKVLVAGTSQGSLFIIDSCFGAILHEFKDSAADITSIVCDSTNQKIYYTGLDSRVFAIGYNEVTDEFIRIGKNRGQSHSINSLVLSNQNTLVSGGMNSDICLYSIDENGFTDNEGDKKKHKFQQIQDLIFFTQEDLVGFYYNKTIGLLRVQVDERGANPGYEYLFEHRSDKYFNSVAYTAKFGYLAVADNEDGKIVIYHVQSGKKVNELNVNCYKLLWFSKYLITLDASKNSLLFYDVSQNFKFEKAVAASEFDKITNVSEFYLTPNNSAIVILDHMTKILMLYYFADQKVKDLSFLMENCHSLGFRGLTNDIILLTKSYKIKLFSSKSQTYEPCDLLYLKKSVGNIRGLISQSDSEHKYLFYSDFHTIILDLSAEEKIRYEKTPKFLLDIKSLGRDRLFELYISWKQVSKEKMEAPINTKKYKAK